MKAGIRTTALGIVLTAVLLCSVLVPQNRIWCISESGHSALETALDGCEHSHFKQIPNHSQECEQEGHSHSGSASGHCEGGVCSDIFLRVTYLPTNKEGALSSEEMEALYSWWTPAAVAAEDRQASPAPSPPFRSPPRWGTVLLI